MNSSDRVELSTPKLLDRFIKLKMEGADLFKLRGNDILIEKIEVKERKTESGIILATDTQQARNSLTENEPTMGVVLMVGSGYADDEDSPLQDISVGNIVLSPKFSAEIYSTFPGLYDITKDTLMRVDSSEVKFLYKDFASFEKACLLLNN